MLKNLLNFQFLFEINRVGLENSDKLFLFVGISAAALALLLKFAESLADSQPDKKFRRNLYSVFLFLAVWEIVWYGLRFQNTRLLGSHFAALLGIAVALVWFLKVMFYLVKKYRQDKVDWEKQQIKQKYLPR